MPFPPSLSSAPFSVSTIFSFSPSSLLLFGSGGGGGGRGRVRGCDLGAGGDTHIRNLRPNLKHMAYPGPIPVAAG